MNLAVIFTLTENSFHRLENSDSFKKKRYKPHGYNKHSDIQNKYKQSF